MEDQDITQIAMAEVLSSLKSLRIDKTDLTRLPIDMVSGGYGNVWFATLTRNPSERVPVAVKELRQGGNCGERSRVAIRLARELKVWRYLNHANLLRLVGYHLDEDMTIAMLISPIMAHGHIQDYLDKAKPGQCKRLQLALDTLEGLKYLHDFEPPICHGDLKSHNVLVTDDIRAVLCDFGLAKVIDESGIPSGLTTSRTLRGSTRYMSPELMDQEESCHTLPSDIWAWGCVFIEITLDFMPYSQIEKELAVVFALTGGQRPAPTQDLELSVRLRALLESCWNLETARRPTAAACCGVLQAELEEVSSGEQALTVYIHRDFEILDFRRISIVRDTSRGSMEQAQSPHAAQNRTLLTSSHLSSSEAPNSHGRAPALPRRSLLPPTQASSSRDPPASSNEIPASLLSGLQSGFTQEQLEDAIGVIKRLYATSRQSSPLAPLDLSDEEKTAIAEGQPKWQALVGQAATNLTFFQLCYPDDTENLLMATAICCQLRAQTEFLNAGPDGQFIVTHEILTRFLDFLRDFIFITTDRMDTLAQTVLSQSSALEMGGASAQAALSSDSIEGPNSQEPPGQPASEITSTVHIGSKRARGDGSPAGVSSAKRSKVDRPNKRRKKPTKRAAGGVSLEASSNSTQPSDSTSAQGSGDRGQAT